MDYEKSYNAMYKFLAWFFFAIAITFYGITNVKALSYTDIGYVHQLSGVTGSVLIEPTYDTETGSPLTINRQQVVYTQIKILNVYVGGYNFVANRQYQIEMEFPNTLLSYANTYQVFGYNNELCTLNYTNSIFNSQWARWNFSCPTATNSIYLKIYNSNNSAIMPSGQWSWNYIYMRYTDTAIDSNTQDTDTIINNNNMNTDRIIDNQNQNTQDIIDSQKVCYDTGINDIDINNKALNSIGDEFNNNSFGISKYFTINGDTKIEVLNTTTSTTGYCFYSANKGKLGCYNESNLTLDQVLTIPENAKYFRYAINKDSKRPQFRICKNGTQATNDNLDDLNDTLNDDDVNGASDEASDFFSNFDTNTFGLTSIITAPLNLIQSLTSSSCTSLHIPLPYLNNKYLDLPCMSSIYSQYFGTFFTLYQTITYGIIAYWVCVRIFNQVKDFKNPEHDEIEVVDL